MLSAREVLLSIAGFFGIVAALGVATVSLLLHFANKNAKDEEEKRKSAPPLPEAAPPTSFTSSTHELVSHSR